MVHSLLAALGDEHRRSIESRLTVRSYARGRVVFDDGDRADALYLVDSGRFDVQVVTPAGTIIVLRVLHPDEFFGELALTHPLTRRTGRVTALEPSKVRVLRYRDFEELRAADAAIDRLLVNALASRVRDMSAQIAELLMPAEQRVLRRLAVLADAYGGDVRLSQGELARMTGTVRQTVNRVLAEAERDGAVVRRRGAVRVIDRAILEQLASA